MSCGEAKVAKVERSVSIGGGRFRADGRSPGQLRKVKFALDAQKWAEGSCTIEMGDTRVLCAATIEDRVPPHLRGKGLGWVTAEYNMLPRATRERTQREVVKGRQGGRTMEIQRLIGRALRGVVDTSKIGDRTITVDCDVLQADGGTRTASITGGYVALALALRKIGAEAALDGQIAAVSVGIVDGVPLLDLDYSEDSHAEVDFNVVGTEQQAYVEVQGTAEGKPFDRAGMDRLLELGRRRAAAALQIPAHGARPASDVAGEPAASEASCSDRDRFAATSSPSCASCSTCPTTDLLSLRDVGLTDSAVEDGETFEDNADIKALALRRDCPACPRWPTTRASRSTRSTADLASRPDATPVRTRPTSRTTPSCWPSSDGFYGPTNGPRAISACCVLVDDGDGRRRQTTRHVRGPHRRSPRGDGRLWLRPDLRAAHRAGRRPHRRRDERVEEKNASRTAPTPRAPCANACSPAATASSRGRARPDCEQYAQLSLESGQTDLTTGRL